MDEPAAKRRPWVKWLLIASLGLNLALLGLIGGALLHGPPGPPPPPGLWQYGKALPEPYRKDLGEALRQSHGDWKGPRNALRGQRAALADALVAQPYDPGAVGAVLAREPRLSDELAVRGARMLLDQIARMSPEDRAAYAEALRQKPLDDRGPK